MKNHLRAKAASMVLVAGLSLVGAACADDDGGDDATTGETTTDGAEDDADSE